MAGVVTTTRDGDTATRILDAAERLIQQRGFNAFSYADIAAELHITKPSLHYHFANKAELGLRLIERYRTRFGAALATLDTNKTTALARLEGYAKIYLDVLMDQRMCLCGMLAADYQTLPAAMQQSVLSFFDENEQWLSDVLDSGLTDGSLTFTDTSRDTARLIISCLEGAILVARAFNDPGRFRSAATNLITGLTADEHPSSLAH